MKSHFSIVPFTFQTHCRFTAGDSIMSIGTFGWYVFWGGLTAHLVGRLFWPLTAPSDSISVYIESSHRDRSSGNSVM